VSGAFQDAGEAALEAAAFLDSLGETRHAAAVRRVCRSCHGARNALKGARIDLIRARFRDGAGLPARQGAGQ
jgi:hypothetical protein